MQSKRNAAPPGFVNFLESGIVRDIRVVAVEQFNLCVLVGLSREIDGGKVLAQQCYTEQANCCHWKHGADDSDLTRSRHCCVADEFARHFDSRRRQLFLQNICLAALVGAWAGSIGQ
eukprot:3941928-Rhodomonas_salina.9